MNIGYARFSTQDHNLDLQIEALAKIGCDEIFTDVASGAKAIGLGQGCLDSWLEVERQALHNGQREAEFRFSLELEAKERNLDATVVIAEFCDRVSFDK